MTMCLTKRWRDKSSSGGANGASMTVAPRSNFVHSLNGADKTLGAAANGAVCVEPKVRLFTQSIDQFIRLQETQVVLTTPARASSPSEVRTCAGRRYTEPGASLLRPPTLELAADSDVECRADDALL